MTGLVGLLILDLSVWLLVWRLQAAPSLPDVWGQIQRNQRMIFANLAVIVVNLAIVIAARIIR
jgi:hypothetical protein